jgi:hypothetical protein
MQDDGWVDHVCTRLVSPGEAIVASAFFGVADDLVGRVGWC